MQRTDFNFETLRVEIDARGIAGLVLNRPEKRNALSSTMIAELTAFAQSVRAGSGIRAIILSGEGDVFCAGGDLDWMKTQIKARREDRMREARKLADMLQALNEMPVPLIGQIHGGAFGGGVGLACVCDVVVAASDAKFGLTETRLGLIPATIGPYAVARLGESMARRVFMSGRLFDAQEAIALGLVASAVPADTLANSALTEAKPYLSAAPHAVMEAKSLVRYLGARIDRETISETIGRLADVWEGPEALEGIDAFFQKRKPKWFET